MIKTGMLRQHAESLTLLALLADVILFMIAGLVAFYMQFGNLALSSHYQLALIMSGILVVLLFSSLRIYQSLRGRRILVHLWSLYLAIAAVMLGLAAIGFVTKTGQEFSRAWFAYWFIYVVLVLTVFRLLFRLILHWMRKRGHNQRRIVIFGANKSCENLITRIQGALWTGFEVVVILDDDVSKNDTFFAGINIKKTPDDLSAFIKKLEIDEIWLTISLQSEQRIKEVLFLLRHNVVNIRYFLDLFGINLLSESLTDILGMPAVNIESSPMVGINCLLKAIEDRVVAAIILLLTSPMMLIIAALIRFTSKGPVLYRQKRTGIDGKVITVYKFRTMYMHKEPEGVVTQAIKNDPRITKIGHFLRRTSLDELPQFINVLQGCMSIVGPRPHAIEHNEQYKEMVLSYMQRHQVKPGITGWAQINGWRGETDTLEKMEKRVEHDLYYIRNWSVWFDVKIIILTILKGFFDKRAY